MTDPRTARTTPSGFSPSELRAPSPPEKQAATCCLDSSPCAAQRLLSAARPQELWAGTAHPGDVFSALRTGAARVGTRRRLSAACRTAARWKPLPAATLEAAPVRVAGRHA
eukprot:353361-Chlamydomonas_euryale.AAC.5